MITDTAKKQLRTITDKWPKTKGFVAKSIFNKLKNADFSAEKFLVGRYSALSVQQVSDVAFIYHKHSNAVLIFAVNAPVEDSLDDCSRMLAQMMSEGTIDDVMEAVGLPSQKPPSADTSSFPMFH